MPQLTPHQQGWIGERLITEYSKLNPDAHHLLFRAIANDIEDNFSDKLERCDKFSMRIINQRDNGSRTKNGYDDIQWSYTRGEVERNETGLVTNIDEVSTWSPDAVVVVSFSDLAEFYTLEYPIEIKTGSSARLTGEQRKGFIAAEINCEARPYLVKVNIAGLPEKYGFEVKRYVESIDQIRKLKQSDLDSLSDQFQEKRLG